MKLLVVLSWSHALTTLPPFLLLLLLANLHSIDIRSAPLIEELLCWTSAYGIALPVGFFLLRRGFKKRVSDLLSKESTSTASQHFEMLRSSWK